MVTEPARRAVTEVGSGESRYPFITGTYAALPAGERAPLVMAAEGLTAASMITAEATTMYASAF